jgi:ribosomal protein S18 acetylase RimI-like enzyme
LIHQRLFNKYTDPAKMIALAASYSQGNLHIIDLPYRLSSWVLDDPGNGGIWEDDQQNMVGWVVIQTPFWTIDFSYAPDKEDGLFPEMLAWTDKRVNELLDSEYGHPLWFVDVFDNLEQRIRILEHAGFTSQSDVGEDSLSKVFLLTDLQTLLKGYPAPKGFIVRPIDGQIEAEEYAEMQREVFGTKNMTMEWRSRTMKAPGYTRGLDIVVEAPDGKLAAFCIGWQMKNLDGIEVGQIEPLGCRAAYRHLALGRVALAEVLQRMKTMGIRKVFVETDSFRDTAYRLYQSMGFEKVRDVLVFRKDFPENQS